MRNLIINSCLAHLNNSKLIEFSLGVLLFHSLVRTIVSSFKVMASLFGMKMGCMLNDLSI